MTDQIDNTESVEAINTEAAPIETNNEATNPTNFIDQITDPELKGYIEKAGYKDIQGLVKSTMHLEKKLGAPKEPESYAAEDYKYDLPENYTQNDDLLNPVKDKAIELGIKPEAFKALVETFTGKESELIQQMQADQETSHKELQSNLKQEWGNEYDSNLKLADETWQRFATDADDKVLESLPANAQLAVAKVMANVGQRVGEGSTGRIGDAEVNPQEEIDKIYSDTSHPYWDHSHPDHNKAVARVRELNK